MVVCVFGFKPPAQKVEGVYTNIPNDIGEEMGFTFAFYGYQFERIADNQFYSFAVIDIIGAVPVLISLKTKLGGINEFRATLVAGGLMILFLFIGEPFLNLLGVDVRSFAVAGSVVIFLIGLEMVMGFEFF